MELREQRTTSTYPIGKLCLMVLTSIALTSCYTPLKEAKNVYIPTTLAEPSPTSLPLSTNELNLVIDFSEVIKNYSLDVYSFVVNDEEFPRRISLEMFRYAAEHKMIQFVIVDINEDSNDFSEYERIAKENQIVVIKPDTSIQSKLTREKEFIQTLNRYINKDYINFIKKALLVTDKDLLEKVDHIFRSRTVVVTFNPGKGTNTQIIRTDGSAESDFEIQY